MTSLISNVGKTVGIGVLGAIVSRSSMWLSKKVEQKTGLHIGSLTNYIMPDCVTRLFKAGGEALNYPLKSISNRIKQFWGMTINGTKNFNKSY